MTMDAHAHAPGEQAHPTPGLYTKIAVTLVILTALEVAVYYVESIQAYLIPILVEVEVAEAGGQVDFGCQAVRRPTCRRSTWTFATCS